MFRNISNSIRHQRIGLKKILLGLFIIVFIGIIIFALVNFSGFGTSNSIEINKSYDVVARTEEELRTDGEFKLNVISSEFSDSILVKGNKATPVKGKQFLVLNIEITNPYPVTLYAFPVDLFRLIREDGVKIAPQTHQGKVEIRPKSTKKSNVAFVVEPGEKDFKIEVGDVNDPTETLEIHF